MPLMKLSRSWVTTASSDPLSDNIDFKGDWLRLANKFKDLQTSGEKVHTHFENE